MKTVLKILKTLLWLVPTAAVALFGALQAVYWLNLDNKFMFLLHRILRKITDKVPRDRRF